MLSSVELGKALGSKNMCLAPHSSPQIVLYLFSKYAQFLSGAPNARVLS